MVLVLTKVLWKTVAFKISSHHVKSRYSRNYFHAPSKCCRLRFYSKLHILFLTYPSSFFYFICYHIVITYLFYISGLVVEFRRNVCNFHKDIVKIFYWLNKTLWRLTDNTKSRVEGDQPFYDSTTLRGNMMQLHPGNQWKKWKWLKNDSKILASLHV